MDEIPHEVLLNILLYVDDNSMSNVMLVNVKFEQICNDDYFCKRKLLTQYTYLNLSSVGISNISYKQFYKLVLTKYIKYIPIFLEWSKTNIHTHIWVKRDETVADIVDRIKNVMFGSRKNDRMYFIRIINPNFDTICKPRYYPKDMYDYISIGRFWDNILGFMILSSDLSYNQHYTQ